VVIGVDLLTPQASDAQITSFKNATGASYFFVKNGGSPAGYDMDDLVTGYGERHNFVVISKQGIIRFNAVQEFMFGNRYHRDRIRACVDSLLAAPYVGVDDPTPTGVSFDARPNPSAGLTTVEFSSAVDGVPALVTVHDLAGRRVATLWEGPALLGVTSVQWDGRTSDGRLAPAGVYLLQATIGSERRNARLVRIQ
jgi:hypothetical protein